MNEWLTENAWNLLASAAAFISSYAILGYRMKQIEEKQKDQSDEIELLKTKDTETRVTLAKIETNIEYIKTSQEEIKLQISKLIH